MVIREDADFTRDQQAVPRYRRGIQIVAVKLHRPAGAQCKIASAADGEDAVLLELSRLRRLFLLLLQHLVVPLLLLLLLLLLRGARVGSSSA